MASQDDGVAPLLRALVLLQLEMRPDRPDAPKPEILLRRAGLGITEIASLLGKSYDGTAKTLSRAGEVVRRPVDTEHIHD